jgi:hypothetical protein
MSMVAMANDASENREPAKQQWWCLRRRTRYGRSQAD